MKKTLFTGLSMWTVVLWVLIGAPRTWSKAGEHTVDLSHLPRGLIVPAALPAGLDDPILLEAWIRLYNDTTPVELWGDKTVTGRELAEFLREAGIPLVWDVQGVCHNASCSWQFCAGATCKFDDGQPGVDPIYIFPTHATQMPKLVATLAHEALHRTQPFGPVHDSKFEEFWACKVSAAFDPQSGFQFDGYDPLVSGYLILWIRDNGLTPYYALPDYPLTFATDIAGLAAPSSVPGSE